MIAFKQLIVPKRQSPEERRREMLEHPVQPLIISLAAPSIFANVITTIYNLADTFFVGQNSETTEAVKI